MYTPKGNISVVATYLQQNGLFLDHPSLPADMQRLRAQHYFNPHNPPPGGHSRALGVNTRLGYAGPGGSNTGRWNTVSGKSIEVQRSQVDELFKSLRDGDELEETDARTCYLLKFDGSPLLTSSTTVSNTDFMQL